MRTTEAVKGRWANVFEFYGLPPITGKNHFKGECPVCGRKGRYRCDDKDGAGTWICVCGSGDGWKLLELTQKKDFATMAGEIDAVIGNEYQPDTKSTERPKPRESQKVRESVIAKFGSLVALRGTGAELYLHGRGINKLPAEWVRFNETEKTPYGVKQAMWALATDDKAKPCYLHRTFLDGAKKANISTQKRMLSLQDESYLDYAGSVAIRMHPIASTLGIAEGIETALSCHQIYNCNTWAVLNSSLMKKFRAPAGVKHLIIFADCDDNGAGQAAAFECGHRNILSKNDVERVSIRWPEKGDFNDMLMNGAKVYEWPLRRAA
ncbi:toprim domain-containing protein [Serratia marcescens]|nr:toprim domain-containing protein [Serratia marcescens]